MEIGGIETTAVVAGGKFAEQLFCSLIGKEHQQKTFSQLAPLCSPSQTTADDIRVFDHQPVDNHFNGMFFILVKGDDVIGVEDISIDPDPYKPFFANSRQQLFVSSFTLGDQRGKENDLCRLPAAGCRPLTISSMDWAWISLPHS